MIVVRNIKPGEGNALLELVRALAESHGEADKLTATPDDLEKALFRAEPVVGCIVAECDGKIAGCAFWHRSFSTFRGQEVMYLEDLSVLLAYRRRGIAKALMAGLARIATEQGYASIYWMMMAWNVEARHFYESIGATIEDGTSFCRIDGDAMKRLAQ